METLEFIIKKPETQKYPAGMILCHPHPQFGGDFRNVIIRKIEKHCSQIIPTLRFNFRGVGQSTGSYDNGIGEKEDVIQMVDLLLEKCPEIRKIIIAGYSFGAAIGAAAAVDHPKVIGYIAVAFPFDLFPVHGKESNCDKLKLFITGSNDDFTPISVFEKWYERFDSPKDKFIFQGEDHFFGKTSEELGKIALKTVEEWLSSGV